MLRNTVVAAFLAAALSSCSTSYERRDPTGEPFPNVRGTALDDRSWSIPGDLAGKEVILLIGYEMRAQFDLDRWILGLHDARVDALVYELPTIPGLLPGLFADRIDAGMRRGIPQEEWAIVITIYDDAEALARFTGNRNGLTARVVLLDGEGRVAFFHDRGYSAASVLRLKEVLARLRA